MRMHRLRAQRVTLVVVRTPRQPRFTIGCLKARREREMKSHIQNENEREFYFLRAEQNVDATYAFAVM